MKGEKVETMEQVFKHSVESKKPIDMKKSNLIFGAVVTLLLLLMMLLKTDQLSSVVF